MQRLDANRLIFAMIMQRLTTNCLIFAMITQQLIVNHLIAMIIMQWLSSQNPFENILPISTSEGFNIQLQSIYFNSCSQDKLY